jgi:hypothetical protein
MISHPFLVEKVSSADKFSPAAFVGLLAVILIASVWFRSSFHLLGNFWQSIGIFGRDPVVNVYGSDTLDTASETSSENLTFAKQAGSLPDGQRRTEPDEIPITDYTLSTLTPYPTYTPYPTPTPFDQFRYRYEPVENQILMPEINYDINQVLYNRQDQLIEKINNPDARIYRGKYSYYWPPLGGVNCDRDCNKMANGQNPADFIGIGWACDMSISFGTVIYIKELNIYGICVDRGGMIRQDSDGLFWFDHLIRSPFLNYGSEITVFVYDQ